MRNYLLDRDIAIYVRSKLTTHRRLKRWPGQIRENVIEALSTKANGMCVNANIYFENVLRH